ncbi:response regulator transcription factor [Owenweeksia hongkongensis]|uniref:response regulator transcription factor n=1 Tax=Owenweeksia hongkongensis TaxID=253245 RepID=UPI003A93AFD7
MKRVLVIEDDPDIIELISLHLTDLDCTVEKQMNGLEGFNAAQASSFDLIILDLMLPGMDGIAICQKLRALDNFTPILMLTAKAEEFDKVLGLESGADDYLTKPFGIREFIARVKAILRRQEIHQGQSEEKQASEITRGNLHINRNTRKVTLDGNRVELTPKEFDLLCLMAENPGRSFDRDQLLSSVWGYEFNGYEHTVNSHINRLRSKIEGDLSQPQYILTTWGVGYRFNDEI